MIFNLLYSIDLPSKRQSPKFTVYKEAAMNFEQKLVCQNERRRLTHPMFLHVPRWTLFDAIHSNRGTKIHSLVAITPLFTSPTLHTRVLLSTNTPRSFLHAKSTKQQRAATESRSRGVVFRVPERTPKVTTDGQRKTKDLLSAFLFRSPFHFTK